MVEEAFKECCVTTCTAARTDGPSPVRVSTSWEEELVLAGPGGTGQTRASFCTFLGCQRLGDNISDEVW